MNPKDKAKELLEKMYNSKDQLRKYPMCFDTAKQCALISCDFAEEFITGNLNESFDKTMYLFDVKQEIEKL